MGARKPNTSANYKSQACRKRGWTGSNSAFNFAEDCGTIAAFLFYHPLLNKWCGAHNGPEDMPDPDWNEVVRCVRSEQIVENGKLVKQTTRGRRKVAVPERAKSPKVQKHTPTQPRRRGRPRKNRTSPCQPFRPKGSVAEVITVAGDTSSSPPEALQRRAELQRPASAADVVEHREDQSYRRTEANLTASSGRCNDNSSTPACLSWPLPMEIMDDDVHAQSQTESSKDQDRSFHIEDGAFDWLLTGQALDDQYPSGDLAFGNATQKFDDLATGEVDCYQGYEANLEEVTENSRVATIINNSTPGRDSSVISNTNRHEPGHAPSTPLPVRERMEVNSNRINSAGNVAYPVPGRSNLTAVFAIWQRTIQDFSKNRAQCERYELQSSTPVATVF
ncbi:unnamed protein product [Fusarium langsethiae]|nr:unnamed protein product [Fusarium langsethiae]